MSYTPNGIALIAAVVTVAALAGGAAAAVPSDDGSVAQLNATERDATAPGAQLAGVIGVQQAEVTGDVDNRSFGVRIATAASDEERAAIIAQRQAETSQQVATQADRLADLRAARDAGNITQGEYQARVAVVASHAANAERAADQLNRTARDLPEAVRERNGINETAIDRLRTDARNLSGPETAAVARSIGDTTARNPMAATRGPFGERGPSGEMPADDAAGSGRSTDRPDADRAGGPKGDEPTRDTDSPTPAGSDANSSANDRNAEGNGSGDGRSNADANGAGDGSDDAGSDGSDDADSDSSGGAGSDSSGDADSDSSGDAGSDSSGDTGNSNSGQNSGDGANRP